MPLEIRITGTLGGLLLLIVGVFLIKKNRESAEQMIEIRRKTIIHGRDEYLESAAAVRNYGLLLYVVGGVFSVAGLFALVNAVFNLNLKP